MRTKSRSILQRVRLFRAIEQCCRNESGNIAIIMALLMPLLIGLSGFAMDYGYASYVKQRIDRAAEAAVLGSVSQSAATAMGGYSNSNGLSYYGNGLFAANTSQLSVGAISSNLTFQSTSQNGLTAKLTYSASVPTIFSGIVGISSFPVSGMAQATANPITYINYYIVVDISQSMGIGSTSADMTALYNRTATYNGNGCVFGCHVALSGESYTNEYLAHQMSPRITLRIDSAITAIQTIIADAQAAAGSNKNIKIGLYTMSADPVTGKLINTIAAPTNNYTSLTTAATNISLGNNTSGGIGDSNFSTQLNAFNLLLPVNGSGASAVAPLNYVFIITDGLTDTPSNSCTSGHCTSAINPASCTALKAKATVGVIYTTYIPIYNQNNSANGYDINYQQLVLPYVNQLGPNLQSCATSSSFYFQATDGPALNASMKSLFASTQQAALLQK